MTSTTAPAARLAADQDCTRCYGRGQSSAEVVDPCTGERTYEVNDCECTDDGEGGSTAEEFAATVSSRWEEINRVMLARLAARG